MNNYIQTTADDIQNSLLSSFKLGLKYGNSGKLKTIQLKWNIWFVCFF